VKSGFALACKPDDVRSIADSLAWFLSHRDTRVAMGELGRKQVLEDWNYECQFAPVLRSLA
jgi:spore maturation protein CgeB